MKSPICWPFKSRIMLLVLIFAVQHGLRANQSLADETKLSWDSPKMLQLKENWGSLYNTWIETPDKIPGEPAKRLQGETLELFEHLLRSQLSDDEVRQLAASCEYLPVDYTKWNDYDRQIVSYIVKVLVSSGDRDNLVNFLSKRLPWRVVLRQAIEDYLAEQSTRLPDSFLVLAEAYSKCQIPEVRHQIANAIRRAFIGRGIQGKDEAEFVENAVQWYKKNKESLVINIGYTFNNADNDNFEHLEKYDDRPGWGLFKLEQELDTTQGYTQKIKSAKPKISGKVVDWQPTEYASGAELEKRLADLEGSWEITAATFNGQVVPPERIKLKPEQFIFHKGTLQMVSPDGEFKKDFRIKLGRQKQPLQMDLLQMPKYALKKEQTTPLIFELQEETTSAIYELNGDIMRIGTAFFGDWRRPTSFDAEQGSWETAFTLKRIPK